MTDSLRSQRSLCRPVRHPPQGAEVAAHACEHPKLPARGAHTGCSASVRRMARLGLALAAWQLGAAAPSARAAPPAPAPVTASAPAPPKPAPVPPQLPERSKLHLFLLAGQSNMAGRGDVE